MQRRKGKENRLLPTTQLNKGKMVLPKRSFSSTWGMTRHYSVLLSFLSFCILEKMHNVRILAAASSAASIISSDKPFLVYGTAWKKEKTAQYVSEAIHTGFRFIDTACQPKHYQESGVGDGWTFAAQ